MSLLRIPTESIVTVPLTAAQSRRLARLMAEADAASKRRDEVLSAVVESVSDRDHTGWTLQIKEHEIVLTAPVASNGVAQAGAMSP